MELYLCTFVDLNGVDKEKLYLFMHFSGIFILHNLLKIEKKAIGPEVKGTALTKNLCYESRER
jgi:hypothetical protein